jgi:hypothetical protein
MMGMNADLLVITANMFPLATGSVRTAVLVIPKADLLAGSISDMTLFEDLDLNTTGFSPQPIVDLDNGSSPLILLSAYNKHTGLLKISSIGGTPSNPTLDTLDGFIDVSPRGSPPDVDQPGPKADVAAGGTHFRTNVVKIHVAGRTNPSLWAAHGVDIGGKAAIEWYEIDAVANTILQSGTIADATTAYNYPSIAVNVIGDVVIGCSGGSPTQFMSSYAFVGVTTGASTTFSSALLLQEGNADYELIDGIGRNRWGDYSATMVDPYAPATFWTIQEFVVSEDVWSTQITQIVPDGAEPGDRWLLDYPVADTEWLLRTAPAHRTVSPCSRSTISTTSRRSKSTA